MSCRSFVLPVSLRISSYIVDVREQIRALVSLLPLAVVLRETGWCLFKTPVSLYKLREEEKEKEAEWE